jgi:hypothetical protein
VDPIIFSPTVDAFISGVITGIGTVLTAAIVVVGIEHRRKRKPEDELLDIFEKAKTDVTNVVATAAKKAEKSSGRRAGSRR